MSLAGVRDPYRNRQYYEDRYDLSSGQSVISASAAATTAANHSAGVLVPLKASNSVDKKSLSNSAQAGAPAAAGVLFPTTSSPTRITVTPAPAAVAGSGAGELGRLMKTTWDDIKELLGFIPTCHNGGTRTPGATCRCPKLFEGALCDKKICLNGGKLERAKYGPVSWDCKCPTPQYIEGTHCETVRCANNAPLRTETNGSWWCDCSGSTFYSGRFCEEFSAPYAIFAVPLACLLLFALCIAVCQMDLCPRRRRTSRHFRHSAETGQAHVPPRTRRRTPAGAQSRPRPGQVPQRATVTQELLIAEDRAMCRRGMAYPQGIVAPYVIRLDTIPHFNPHMIGGVEPIPPAKPMDPPPSYEQAVSAPPVPQPPSYTESANECGPPQTPAPPPPLPPVQPPPPNRLPPPPPSSSS
ncbi:hypothetical protein V3C99_005809 [Haemonchus contortus]